MHLLIEKVIQLTLERQFDVAEEMLRQIDSKTFHNDRFNARNQLNLLNRNDKRAKGTKRRSVSESEKLRTFIRDNYRCRYKHCQRFTIDSSVLRELSRIYPKTFSYHLHWKFEKTHILYWIYTTSLEHKVSFPNGGNSDSSNLITACYLCNDLKNEYSLEKLGWEVENPSTIAWDGLTKYVGQLKQINQNSNKHFQSEVKSQDKNYNKIEDKIVNIFQSEENLELPLLKGMEDENIFIPSDALSRNKIPIGSILKSRSGKGSILLFATIKDVPFFASEKVAWSNERIGKTAILYKVIHRGSGKLPISFINIEFQKCLVKAKEYANNKRMDLSFE